MKPIKRRGAVNAVELPGSGATLLEGDRNRGHLSLVSDQCPEGAVVASPPPHEEMNPTGGTHLASGRRPPYNRRVTRDQVLRRLAETRAELAGLGVRSLDLFGSVVRGDADPDSDVDLLVEFDRAIGLFHFFRVQRRLEEILGCHVDLVMRDAVKPQLRDRIFREAVRAT